MKLLLDTHAYLLLLTNPNKVGKRAKALVTSPESEVLVSVVSFVEIAIKSRKGKIEFDFSLIEKTLNSLAASILDFKLDHARGLSELDQDHDDPFDRMLVAQAQFENAMLLAPTQRCSATRAHGLGTKESVLAWTIISPALIFS